ncbi:MAG TPA: ankyrin repeat domain-containing protein, partial [Pyrinomonadaceae bacterium]|nr:ankyrin repeat domain-containing protein [Pyrinomonadaceae bacterium]
LLMEAVIRKDHELMSVLIRSGADVEIRDKRGWTALHFAAQNSDELAAKLLIDAGANVNSKESHGNNVIWRAVFDAQDGFDLLKLLLSRGALVTEKNDRGISAMDLAISIGDKDLIETLTTR